VFQSFLCVFFIVLIHAYMLFSTALS